MNAAGWYERAWLAVLLYVLPASLIGHSRVGGNLEGLSELNLRLREDDGKCARVTPTNPQPEGRFVNRPSGCGSKGLVYRRCATNTLT